MPGIIVLSIINKLSCFIFITTLRGKYYLEMRKMSFRDVDCFAWDIDLEIIIIPLKG